MDMECLSFVFGAMTLTLGFVWMLLCLRYRVSLHISRILWSEYEPKTRGVTSMRDTIIMKVNGQQSLGIQAGLWVQLICECDLYAKIYGIDANVVILCL